MRTRRIPNWLTGATAAAGLGLWIQQLGADGLVPWTVGLVVGGVLLAVPYALGGMGAGDLKLLAALGSVGGVGFVLRAAVLTGLAGGLLAIGVLAMRAWRGPRGWRLGRTSVPYAPAIATGALVTLVGLL